MVNRPTIKNAFEFVILASLRSKQLIRGCTPRVQLGTHKKTTLAQIEIATGKVVGGMTQQKAATS
jgi:DNA-directed RNA polymerase subunit K/omega